MESFKAYTIEKMEKTSKLEACAFCTALICAVLVLAFTFGAFDGEGLAIAIFVITMIILIAVILLLQFLHRLRHKNSPITTLVCPMCSHKCSSVEDLAAHREACAEEHQEFLEKLQEHPQARCVHCNGPLRLWPPGLGNISFTCANLDCTVAHLGRDILNTGSNCFYCFKCNYAKCSICASEEHASTAETNKIIVTVTETSEQ